MPNYTKLFSSIVTSTIWTEDDKTRIVWITMLAMSDQHGEVHASIPGLARVAGVSVEDVEIALGKFLGPDPYSRTEDFEGRRIEKIDGGWLLLNHAKYRMMASKADAKEANAKRQRRHRERNAAVTGSNGAALNVTVRRDIAEADTDTDTESKKESARASTLVDEQEQTADQVAKRIMSLCPTYAKPACLTAMEMHAITGNLRVFLSLSDDDWQLLSDYMHARTDPGAGFWQPRSRLKFVESIADVLGHATRWSEKHSRRRTQTTHEPLPIGVK